MRVLVFGGQGEMGKQIAEVGHQYGHKSFAFVSTRQMAPPEFDGEFKADWNDIVMLNRACNRQNAAIIIAPARRFSFRLQLEQLNQLQFLFKKYRIKRVLFICPYSWWKADGKKNRLRWLIDPVLHYGESKIREDFLAQIQLMKKDKWFSTTVIHFPSMGNRVHDESSWKFAKIHKLGWQHKKPARFHHFLRRSDLAHHVWNILERGSFDIPDSLYIYKSTLDQAVSPW